MAITTGNLAVNRDHWPPTDRHRARASTRAEHYWDEDSREGVLGKMVPQRSGFGIAALETMSKTLMTHARTTSLGMPTPSQTGPLTVQTAKTNRSSLAPTATESISYDAPPCSTRSNGTSREALTR